MATSSNLSKKVLEESFSLMGIVIKASLGMIYLRVKACTNGKTEAVILEGLRTE